MELQILDIYSLYNYSTFSQAYAGGGTKPPNSRSRSLAKVRVVRSSRNGPMICTPIGSPDGERPIGITVAGRPGGVATVAHTIRDV